MSDIICTDFHNALRKGWDTAVYLNWIQAMAFIASHQHTKAGKTTEIAAYLNLQHESRVCSINRLIQKVKRAWYCFKYRLHCMFVFHLREIVSASSWNTWCFAFFFFLTNREQLRNSVPNTWQTSGGEVSDIPTVQELQHCMLCLCSAEPARAPTRVRDRQADAPQSKA